MIRYSLTCADGHDFESWFRSGADFDALADQGHLVCSICGSTEVKKSVMAPRIGSRSAEPEAPAQPMASGPLSKPGSELERRLQDLRRKVEENSTYVGRDFAREARAMHLGDAPERQIHGEATGEEAKALIEDGVQVLPLPFLPRTRSS
ncbi:DUF1178 family protein [Rhodobacterales bacterium HKCCE2091]|nr:DUF1178 family protein [Rhodobacterales bacterium HKCCE2091]